MLLDDELAAVSVRSVCKFESFNEEEVHAELCVAYNNSAASLLSDGISEVCQIGDEVKYCA